MAGALPRSKATPGLAKGFTRSTLGLGFVAVLFAPPGRTEASAAVTA
jgi:hypothetical protein